MKKLTVVYAIISAVIIMVSVVLALLSVEKIVRLFLSHILFLFEKISLFERYKRFIKIGPYVGRMIND